MKTVKSLSILFVLLFSNQFYSQAPQAFKYQAVARDNAGEILENQSVSFRISVLQGSASGSSVYTETHSGTTNSFGLINLQIGSGTVSSGTFSTIPWGSNSHFVQISMDETGGSNYQLMGTSQLLSVPYAIHAETATSVSGGMAMDNISDVNSSTALNGQVLSWDGANWAPITPAGAAYTQGTGIDITGTTITNTAPDQTVSLTQSGATTISGTYPNFTISSTDNNTT